MVFHIVGRPCDAPRMGRLLLILVTLLPAPALAHGCGLDDNGGHHDRRTGEYHCHRAS